MNPPRLARPWAAFAGCSLIWGSTFFAIGVGDESLPPLWAASLRLALAAVLLALIVRLRRAAWPRGAGLRAALIYGVLNFGINFSLLYWGETRFPSGLASVMYATNPLTTALMARAVGLERLGPAKIVGALVALIGVALVSGAGTGHTSVLGALAVFGAASIAAASTLPIKRAPRQDPFAVNAVASMVGLPVCLLGSALLHEPHPLPHSAVAWATVLYLTCAGSLTAFVLMTWLLRHWEASRVAYIGVVVPVVALALGALVRHERIDVAQALGAGVVLAGVLIALRPPAPARAGAARADAAREA